MVRIEDPATTIKNQDKCDQNEREFKKKYQINDYFIQINEELIDLALSRCEGNPLISLSFIFNLLTVNKLNYIFLERLLDYIKQEIGNHLAF